MAIKQDRGCWNQKPVSNLLVRRGRQLWIMFFRDTLRDAILWRLDVRIGCCADSNLSRCIFATTADGCFEGRGEVLLEYPLPHPR